MYYFLIITPNGVTIFFIVGLLRPMKEQESITPLEQYVIDFVRKLRTDKGLTQLDIANIMGVARTYIGNVENTNATQKYNLRHINALADYFGISPRQFLPEKAFPVDAPVEKDTTTKPAMVKKAPPPVKKKPARKKAAVKKKAAKK